MNIPDFAEQEVDAIVDEWVAFARTRLPSSHGFTREELADHARVLLLAIAADIRRTQGAQAQHDKAQGNAPGNAPQITSVARAHATQRFDQSFSFDDLVSEFRALRASVIRRWTQQLPQVRHEELAELTRFGEAMDQALSESASLYSRKVDDSRNLLLGVLGHDLRTPLGVVHMSASYLLRTDTLDGAQTKAAARILTSAERMKAMVKDILDFTQTAFGVPLPISPAEADIGELTRSIVGEITTLLPDSKVELACEGELAGRWDGARIQQMLSNLVANAVQHGEGTRVTIHVTGEAEAVTVLVRNGGAAIPDEVQKTLFVPLRQPPQSEEERRSGSSGLGLGLYITREIAVAHGGSIHVTSSGDDGTTFRVRLPRKPPLHADRRARAAAASAAGSPEPPAAGGGADP